MENELKVEHYDASEVEVKKKKILKIVATGIGIAALTTILGCFGLQKAKKSADTTTVNKGSDTIPVIEPVEDEPMIEFIMGGNGAWFNSVIQFTG